MKVHVRKNAIDLNKCSIEFKFELEDDDVREAVSINAGSAKIKLISNHCSFDFDFDIALPHPDLLAMAALKIISPYIGSRLVMDMPVSVAFFKAAQEIYPNLKYINTDKNLIARRACGEKYAVSFSGGADSLATANLCTDDVVLILSARKYHNDVGEFEPWYSTDRNIDLLKSYNPSKCRICVKSDFEFLSTNGHWCIYPDKYSFTIPCILLADHLKLTGILTGDMNLAFTADERRLYDMKGFNKQVSYYNSVGLDMDSPVKGITEVGTALVNKYYKNMERAVSCQYGKGGKPCGRCIKCFRKGLLVQRLNNKIVSDGDLNIYNESRAVNSFLDKNAKGKLHSYLLYSWLLRDLDLSKYQNLNKFKYKLCSKSENLDFMEKIYIKPYLLKPMSLTMQSCLVNLSNILHFMNSEDICNYEKLLKE